MTCIRSFITNISDPASVTLSRTFLKDLVPKGAPNVLFAYNQLQKSITIIPIESNSITKLTISLDNQAPDNFMRKFSSICIANEIKSLHSLSRCHGDIIYQLVTFFQESNLNKTKLKKVLKSLNAVEEVIEVNVEILTP